MDAKKKKIAISSNWMKLAKEVNAAPIAKRTKEASPRQPTPTKARSIPGAPSTADVVAIDCEMVGVGPEGERHALARVAIVNYNGALLYDKFVKPVERVVDFRTHVSGIRPHDLKDAIDFTTVQTEVAALIDRRIVVGHSVKSDFHALLLDHPRKMIRDTAEYRPFRKRGNRAKSLRQLTMEVLGVQIQDGEHSPVQDARAALALYRQHRDAWEEHLAQKYGRRAAGKASATAAAPSPGGASAGTASVGATPTKAVASKADVSDEASEDSAEASSFVAPRAAPEKGAAKRKREQDDDSDDEDQGEAGEEPPAKKRKLENGAPTQDAAANKTKAKALAGAKQTPTSPKLAKKAAPTSPVTARKAAPSPVLGKKPAPASPSLSKKAAPSLAKEPAAPASPALGKKTPPSSPATTRKPAPAAVGSDDDSDDHAALRAAPASTPSRAALASATPGSKSANGKGGKAASVQGHKGKGRDSASQAAAGAGKKPNGALQNASAERPAAAAAEDHLNAFQSKKKRKRFGPDDEPEAKKARFGGGAIAGFSGLLGKGASAVLEGGKDRTAKAVLQGKSAGKGKVASAKHQGPSPSKGTVSGRGASKPAKGAGAAGKPLAAVAEDAVDAKGRSATRAAERGGRMFGQRR